MLDNTTIDMSTNVADSITDLRRALSRAAQLMFSGEVKLRHAAILRELRKTGPLAQIELARATVIDPSLLIRLLDDLEKQTLVKRQRSETDRRRVTVSLTPQGRKALIPLDAAYAELAQAAEGDLSPDERALFTSLATRISQSLAKRVAQNESLEESRERN